MPTINIERSAQGTIEYLVIIAIVVVISLVVVGLVTGLFGSSGATVSQTTQEISLKTKSISITDSVVGQDGNALLKLQNNAGENITINKIIIDGVDHNYGSGESLAMNSAKLLALQNLLACSTSDKTKTHSIKIVYTSAYGVEKIIDYGIINLECTPTVTPSGAYVSESETTPSGPTIDPNLIAHFKLNDNTGTLEVVDSVSGNNGTATRNTSIMTSSKIDRALGFNNNTEYISLPSSTMPTGAGQAFSVFAWVKASSSSLAQGWPNGTNTILVYNIENGSGPQTNGAMMVFYLRPDEYGPLNLEGWGNDLYQYGDATTVYDDTWHLVGATFNGIDTVNLWVDQSIVATNTSDYLSLPPGASLTIGGITNGGYYPNFIIDEERIYNRELTQTDVDNIFNSGNGTESESGDLGNGLVAHYKMNDNSDSNAIVIDTITSQNGTATQNTNLLTSSKINRALSFNGISDYIDLPTIPFDSDGTTISFWINLNDVATTNPWQGISKIGGSRIFWTGNSSYGWFTDSAMITDTLTENTWYHITVVFSGGNQLFYRDGLLIDTSIFSPAAGDNSSIGYNYEVTGDWFNGKMDDVRIYNKALSQPEIEAIYNSGLGTED